VHEVLVRVVELRLGEQAATVNELQQVRQQLRDRLDELKLKWEDVRDGVQRLLGQAKGVPQDATLAVREVLLELVEPRLRQVLPAATPDWEVSELLEAMRELDREQQDAGDDVDIVLRNAALGDAEHVLQSVAEGSGGVAFKLLVCRLRARLAPLLPVVEQLQGLADVLSHVWATAELRDALSQGDAFMASLVDGVRSADAMQLSLSRAMDHQMAAAETLDEHNGARKLDQRRQWLGQRVRELCLEASAVVGWAQQWVSSGELPQRLQHDEQFVHEVLVRVVELRLGEQAATVNELQQVRQQLRDRLDELKLKWEDVRDGVQRLLGQAKGVPQDATLAVREVLLELVEPRLRQVLPAATPDWEVSELLEAMRELDREQQDAGDDVDIVLRNAALGDAEHVLQSVAEGSGGVAFKLLVCRLRARLAPLLPVVEQLQGLADVLSHVWATAELRDALSQGDAFMASLVDGVRSADALQRTLDRLKDHKAAGKRLNEHVGTRKLDQARQRVRERVPKLLGLEASDGVNRVQQWLRLRELHQDVQINVCELIAVVELRLGECAAFRDA